MSVRIFAMTHRKFEAPGNPMYIPVHVGHKNAKEEFGYLPDDTGDNISQLNCYYAELSGVYWVWKNFHSADYVGICHYRRYITDEDGYVFSEVDYEKLFKSFDIVTTKQLELPNSYYYGFGAHHNIAVLDKTGEIIRELYPDYYDTFTELVHKNKTYFANMLVAPKALYDEYCEWLFSILFKLQVEIDLTFEDDYHKRVFGFVSEFLLYVWVKRRGLRALECRVAVIGEKSEIGEIKKSMEAFFKNRDAKGAKEYFSGYLKKRPDILMEASDITGECKLCLQAVSVANLELEACGRCFLEDIDRYDDILGYFRRINRIAERALALYEEYENKNDNNMEAKEDTPTDKASVPMLAEVCDREWFEKNRVSELAVRASLRIYARDASLAKKVFAILQKTVIMY